MGDVSPKLPRHMAAFAMAVPAVEPEVPSYGIRQLASEFNVSLRTLRFYQAKGMLTPRRDGRTRRFGLIERDRLALILQGKRLGFTLRQIRDLLANGGAGSPGALPLSVEQCEAQIKALERQRGVLDAAIAELRRLSALSVPEPTPQRAVVSLRTA